MQLRLENFYSHRMYWSFHEGVGEKYPQFLAQARNEMDSRHKYILLNQLIDDNDLFT